MCVTVGWGRVEGPTEIAGIYGVIRGDGSERRMGYGGLG